MKFFLCTVCLILVFALTLSSIIQIRVPDQGQAPTFAGAIYLFQDFKAIRLDNCLKLIQQATDRFVKNYEKVTYGWLFGAGNALAFAEMTTAYFEEYYNDAIANMEDGLNEVQIFVHKFIIAPIYALIMSVFTPIWTMFEVLIISVILVIEIVRVVPMILSECILLIVRLVNYFLGYTLPVPEEQVSPSATEGARGNLPLPYHLVTSTL